MVLKGELQLLRELLKLVGITLSNKNLILIDNSQMWLILRRFQKMKPKKLCYNLIFRNFCLRVQDTLSAHWAPSLISEVNFLLKRIRSKQMKIEMQKKVVYKRNLSLRKKRTTVELWQVSIGPLTILNYFSHPIANVKNGTLMSQMVWLISTL